jgi:homoserine dehydrogenase
MSEHGTNYGDALKDAQDLGYAEPNPTADVSGADAAAKVAILASLAFGTWVGIDDVYHEGIESIDPIDISFASDFGYAVKLIGVCERVESGINARVHPAMIPLEHPLAGIRGATNAIFIEGPTIESLLFAGPGAGGDPTATAVLGDMIDAARETLAGAQVAPRIRFSPGELVDFENVLTEWYVRLVVDNKPGVLAKIASVFGEADVSIKSVWQEGGGSEAALIVVTYPARESDQRAALESLETIDEVIDVGSVIRVLGDSG